MAEVKPTLQSLLEAFAPNVYFQPPSDVRMNFPAIIYTRDRPFMNKANNGAYMFQWSYRITVVDTTPDSDIPESLVRAFSTCVVDSTAVIEGLNHTYLTLYY